jgi:signal transduction histidine kinase
MSHEIRNPIQSLMGALELIVPKDDKEKNELVEICKCGSEVVLNLVSNILDISKINAKKMDLSFGPVDARGTVTKILKLLKQKAQGKGIELKYSDKNRLPPALELDSHRLSQVVLNLVSNAIKFTQQGEVNVEMYWTPNQDNNSRNELCWSPSLEYITPDDPKPNQLNRTYTKEILASSSRSL